VSVIKTTEKREFPPKRSSPACPAGIQRNLPIARPTCSPRHDYDAAHFIFTEKQRSLATMYLRACGGGKLLRSHVSCSD